MAVVLKTTVGEMLIPRPPPAFAPLAYLRELRLEASEGCLAAARERRWASSLDG